VVSSGELDHVIHPEGDDEIADLSRAFNRMTAGLKEITVSKSALEREVAQRKAAEEDLRESRLNLERAQQVGQIGWWRMDTRRNVLTWSDENYRIFGVPKGAPLSYETFVGIVHPDDRTYVDAQWQAALRGDPYVIEHRILVGQQVKWVREKAYLEFDDAGELLGGFGITQDITERKASEEALRAGEAKLRGILDATQESIWMFSPDGVALLANPTALARMGKTAQEVLGNRMPDLLPPDVARTRMARLREVVESARPVEFEDERAGFQFHHSFYPVPDEAGRVTSVVSFSRDITGHKRAEDELRKSRDELELRVRERTAELELRNLELQNFTFAASHDLQEPLRKLRTFGDLIATRWSDSIGEEGRDYVRRMSETSMRMQALLQSLLEYSRVTSKAEPLARVGLKGIVEAVVSDLEVQIREARASVEIGDLPELEADAAQMASLFQNLIANALKFRRKEESLRIRIYCALGGARDPQSGELEIRVEDNGIGFEEQHLDRIFKPFRRLHGKKEYGGVGMGLAICKKVVERHGGSLTARSSPGRGSTFIVRLPEGAEPR
jgi:PAS domain S-box-containing protein